LILPSIDVKTLPQGASKQNAYISSFSYVTSSDNILFPFTNSSSILPIARLTPAPPLE